MANIYTSNCARTNSNKFDSIEVRGLNMNVVFTEGHLARAIELLAEQKDMLLKYDGPYCVPGINNVANDLLFGEDSLDQRFSNAASTYRRINGGMGTLGDIRFWTGNSDESDKLNVHFDEIEKELWSIFNLKN